MSEEIWKPVVGYESLYEVSNLGRIKSLPKKSGFVYKKEMILRQPLRNGYGKVTLAKEGTSKSKYVHRLIAQEFIPNPESKPCINHIDGNKLNNSLDNLEWCTKAHNNRESFRLGLNKSFFENNPSRGRKGKDSIRVNSILNKGAFM